MKIQNKNIKLYKMIYKSIQLFNNKKTLREL